jgi:hypothetical protein
MGGLGLDQALERNPFWIRVDRLAGGKEMVLLQGIAVALIRIHFCDDDDLSSMPGAIQVSLFWWFIELRLACHWAFSGVR